MPHKTDATFGPVIEAHQIVGIKPRPMPLPGGTRIAPCSSSSYFQAEQHVHNSTYPWYILISCVLVYTGYAYEHNSMCIM